MYQENIAVKNPVVCLGPFSATNLAADTANTQLQLPAGNDGIAMPKAGYIIGITGTLTAAATAGSLTVGATIDGTEDTDTTQTVTTAQEFYASFDTSLAVRFAAGEQVGVEYTTGATWDGTTADIDTFLFVVFEDWDF